MATSFAEKPLSRHRFSKEWEALSYFGPQLVSTPRHHNRISGASKPQLDEIFSKPVNGDWKSQESGGLDWNFRGKANPLFFRSRLVYTTNFTKNTSLFENRNIICATIWLAFRMLPIFRGGYVSLREAKPFWRTPSPTQVSSIEKFPMMIETSKYPCRKPEAIFHTVDGSEIRRSPLRLVVYPVMYQVLYIPSGAGFLVSSSTLCGFPTFERAKQKTCHMKSFNWFLDKGPLEFII